MSRYIEPRQFFPAQNVTVAGSPYTSQVMIMKTMARGSFEIIYGAGVSATFSIQGSTSGLNFKDIGVAVPAAAGLAGFQSVDISQSGYAFFQVVATITGGPGTLTVYGNAKE